MKKVPDFSKAGKLKDIKLNSEKVKFEFDKLSGFAGLFDLFKAFKLHV